ncbi:MAG: NADH-quinone oxidoreductase subunit B [Candidatus Aenigmarchaeota archaeon]|nr:NADH-quinone oxidoreductase subunit B [Candidatus Aenigmarchaeota archaeon]NIP40105.1 NADH-quinone oxidoreductase subunit B [Candidatus Aenigmarchaeota archaeon]NIQ18182.1 NADH-quinone oxidoreductase subunit B [Candidatus Aenigmarchaeota archaeon]NIS72939.1 NADH-quinone oxidoreductase subunit B [Candidatus Aenigmarchaeota archaeon]
MKEEIIKLDAENLKKSGKPLLRKLVNYCRKKSPWVLHMSGSGCNGCAIEILASLTPKYDLERFGILDKGSPRHADILIIEGPINVKMRDRIKTIYEQMGEPKYVIAFGTCPISKGVFYDCYNVVGPLEKIIPVDAYVPGCPPKPEALIDGVVKVLKKMGES